MGNIAKELAKQAKVKGICEEWYFDLKNEKDVDRMLDMYIRGIDFCLSNDYPTNDYIRANFVGRMEHKGIHLDERLNVVNDKTVVCLGSCFGTIETHEFTVSQVFVKHNSEVIISAHGNSFIMVDMFDNSKVTIYAYDDAKVCLNHYGGDLTISSKEGNSVVKIIEKHKQTY